MAKTKWCRECGRFDCLPHVLLKQGRAEKRRTCRRDGTEWYVGRDAINAEALASTAGIARIGASMSAAPIVPGLFATKRAVQRGAAMDRIDNAVAAAKGTTSCPTCGSTAYDEEVVPT